MNKEFWAFIKYTEIGEVYAMQDGGFKFYPKWNAFI